MLDVRARPDSQRFTQSSIFLYSSYKVLPWVEEKGVMMFGFGLAEAAR